MRPLISIVRPIHEFASDLRYAMRTWPRQPGLAAIAVISLAAGIGLNTAVFSIINTIFFQSIRGVPHADRVVSIGGRSPFVTYREVRDNTTALRGVGAWQPVAVSIRLRDIALRGVVPIVSDTYFDTLQVRPARGRFFEPARSSQPVARAEAVLDYEFWSQTLASDEAVLGETVHLNGTYATIVGVAPPAFHGFGPVRPPLWVSMDLHPALTGAPPTWEDTTQAGWRIFGRIAPGASVDRTNAELRLLADRSPSDFPGGPIRAETGPEQLSGPVSAEKRIEFLLVVVLPLVVVGLILWIGCSNVANLLMARASSRRKEIAIRLANGATRARVVRLLLTESLLLASAGAAAGVLLAVWTMDFVWATLPDVPRLDVQLDTNVLLYTGLVSVVATLLFGLAPALHATRVDVSPLLKGEGGTSGDGARGAAIRRFFLVTQFACSMALLVVAGTFVRSLVETHVGSQAAVIDHVATAYLEASGAANAAHHEHWQTVRRELLRVPHVTSVTLLEPRRIEMRAVPDGADSDADHPSVIVQRTDSNYLQTMSVPLIVGSGDLSAPTGSGRERVVLNENAARRIWGTEDVAGKRLSLDGRFDVHVAGVIGNHGDEPLLLRAMADDSLAGANVLVRTSQPAGSVVPALRATVLRLSADRAVTRVSTLREAWLGPLHRLTRMAALIAVLVLTLASIGLYGSVSFVTTQRTREIAIRLAIGAPRMAVLRLLGHEGAIVVAGGAAVGLLLTSAAFQFMSGMIFATWRLDPVTIAGVLMTFSVVTLGACYLPARRALRIQPIEALRAE